MHDAEEPAEDPEVTRLRQLPLAEATAFFASHGLRLEAHAEGADIPGSYWGAPEAGLIGNTLHARPDTPVHSLLHTASHWLCMDQAHRAEVHTNAGGDDAEEEAVCYLQCLLAEHLPGYSRAQVFADMDAWGYSFMLGSTGAWFERDGADARAWLKRRGLPTA